MSSTPELHAVLATLAQFSRPRPALVQPWSLQHEGSQRAEPQFPPPHEGSLRAEPQLPQQQEARVSNSTIDPATIITWQEGLRCVTKIASQNKNFGECIRRMMREQRAQEMRWYAEHQKLKQTQANRQKASAQAMSILRSLNSNQSSNTEVDFNPDAELIAYYQKLHRARQSMETEMSYELKALGVPYFGTRSSLIQSGDAKDQELTSMSQQGSSTPTISPAELLVLQRRMLQHLEDLYRE